MTPSFMGLMATMLPGVRPSISFASLPTASTSPLFLLMATMEGSLTTIPLPLAKTKVLAVPRSIARSEENRLNKERKFIEIKVVRIGKDKPRKPEVVHLNGSTSNASGTRHYIMRLAIHPQTNSPRSAVFGQH